MRALAGPGAGMGLTALLSAAVLCACRMLADRVVARRLPDFDAVSAAGSV